MPEKESNLSSDPSTSLQAEKSTEEFDQRLEKALQETVEKLTAQFRQHNSRIKKNSDESKPVTAVVPERSETKSDSKLQASKIGLGKKPKSQLKSEVTRLKKEREQLKKKVASLAKQGANYQAKLGAFFAEIDKKSE